MNRKRQNPHKPFMVFNAVLFFAVLFITGLFLYLAYTFKRDAEKKTNTYQETYHVEITSDFAGKDISIYLNDSLLISQVMPDSTIQLDIRRFAEEHALMIVDNETDIATPFNLPSQGGKIIIRKSGDEIILEETPSQF